MKNSYLAISLCFILFFSCKKDKNENTVYGTIKVKVYGTSNTYLLAIENPDRTKQDFVCDDTIGTLSALYYNCSNSVQITNLPASLVSYGGKIRFSKWKDITVLDTTLRYSFSSRLIEVYDASIAF